MCVSGSGTILIITLITLITLHVTGTVICALVILVVAVGGYFLIESVTSHLVGPIKEIIR